MKNGSSTLSSEKGEGKEVEDDEIVFESQNEKN